MLNLALSVRLPQSSPLALAQTVESGLVQRSDSELSVITAHHFGRSKSRTTPCSSFAELLRTRGYQRRCLHKRSHC